MLYVYMHSFLDDFRRSLLIVLDTSTLQHCNTLRISIGHDVAHVLVVIAKGIDRIFYNCFTT